jgi:hypothetical protein
VEPELLQGGDLAAVEAVERAFGGDHRDDRLVQPNAVLEQLRRAVPHPAGAEGDAADAPAGLARRVPVRLGRRVLGGGVVGGPPHPRLDGRHAGRQPEQPAP